MLLLDQIILYILQRIFYKELIMTIDNKFIDKKLLHDINREAAKIPALSTERID